MILKQLSFQHFMPYRDKVTLNLENCGLVLVRGENKVSVSADSNGSGKSAILDALSWVLFGQTLRGIKADEVACRFTEAPCVVELEFTNPQVSSGMGFKIVRGRRPLTFYFQSEEISEDEARRMDAKETQACIEAHLGFGFQTFKNAVIFGQGAFERFALADQAEQMKMLDEIQGLSFKAALDKAKKWRDTWLGKQLSLENELSQMKVSQTQALQQRDQLRDAMQVFQEGKGDRIKAAEYRLAEARKREGSLQTQVKQAAQSLGKATKLREDLKRAEKKMTELNEQLAQQREEYSRVQSEMGGAEGRQQKLQREIEQLLSGKVCPTCRVQVIGTRVEEIRKAFTPDLAQLDRGVKLARAVVTKVRQQKEEISRQVVALPSIANLHEELIQAESQARLGVQAQRDLVSVSRLVVDEAQFLAAERVARFEGEALLKSLEQDLAKSRGDFKTIEQQILLATNTIQVAGYWVEAFGDRGLRSLLFDSMAGYLNQRLWHHLGILTSGECTAQVSALRPLKSGRMKEELSLGMSWGWGAESYKGGSAGQDRRIDLALFAALQDVAEARTARPFPIKVWDEPGDALDARGREIFCRWVSEQARERGTGILITHSDEIAGLIQPDQIWTSVLEKDGAHVQVEVGYGTGTEPARIDSGGRKPTVRKKAQSRSKD